MLLESRFFLLFLIFSNSISLHLTHRLLSLSPSLICESLNFFFFFCVFFYTQQHFLRLFLDIADDVSFFFIFFFLQFARTWDFLCNFNFLHFFACEREREKNCYEISFIQCGKLILFWEISYRNFFLFLVGIFICFYFLLFLFVSGSMFSFLASSNKKKRNVLLDVRWPFKKSR